MSLTNNHLELMLGVLASHGDPMSLENLTYFVELGPPKFDMDDLVVRRSVTVNGVEVGEVDVERVQDMIARVKAAG